MIDSTCECAPSESRRHFSPQPTIPQGFGVDASRGHKGRVEPIEAIQERFLKTVLDMLDAMWQACRSDVANHPQSLWISLWRRIRVGLQVALPKGFFFFCSNFERSSFMLNINVLQALSPLSTVLADPAAAARFGGKFAVDSRFRCLHSEKCPCQVSDGPLHAFLRPDGVLSYARPRAV
jgi:hypothetical protein